MPVLIKLRGRTIITAQVNRPAGATVKVRTENGTDDIRAVWFENGKVVMIDQRELPD